MRDREKERAKETVTSFLTAFLGREKRAGAGGACFLKEPLRLCSQDTSCHVKRVDLLCQVPKWQGQGVSTC